MSWATTAIVALKSGMVVQVRPVGHSMEPLVKSGALCRIEPAHAELGEIDEGDIVLCHVNGRDYLHLVKSIRAGRYLIGNNRGGTNGWVGPKNIYGKCTKVEP